MKTGPHCDLCPLRDKPGPVNGQGDKNAILVAIGQNPGPTEIESLRPFDGSSGKVLDYALGKVGISRAGMFVTNVVRCFVPPGEPVPAKAVSCCRAILDEELGQVPKKKVIITLGSEAFNELTGKELQLRHNRKAAEKNPRTWLRGCPFVMEDGTIILPTVHPAFVMRSGFMVSGEFRNDLAQARMLADGTRRIPEDHYNGDPTDQEVVEYVTELRARGEGATDIETPESTVDEDDLDPLYQTPINVVGLSHTVGEAIGVRPDQLELLRPLFETQDDRPPILWAYNTDFDFYHLGKRFNLRGIRPADPMLGFHLLWPDVTNKDLATCLSYFCSIPYYKNWRKLQPEKYDTIGNCRDTYGALWSGQEIMKQLRSLGMENLFWSHMMPLVPICRRWNVTGTNCDVDSANHTLLILYKILEKYQTWWSENIPTVDWQSPKQLLELFAAQGLPIIKRLRQNKTRTPSVDDEVLELYVEKYKNQTAHLVQLLRRLKHAGDFLNLAGPDGRIHPRFKPHGQAGGRIQATGDNVQTIPEEIGSDAGFEVHPRSIVVPDSPEDQVIGVSDFSQIELWVYAWYAKDPNLLAVKESGDYVYGIFYEDIFQEPFFQAGCPRRKSYTREDVPPWKLLVAKSWPLGFIYGRGVPDPKGLPITKTKAQEIQAAFHRKYSRVGVFHTDLLYRATRDGFLQTVFKRLRRFPNPRGQRNEILAFPGQSTAVDILIRNALLPLEHEEGLKKNIHETARVLFSVHDSVVWQAPREKWRQACDYVTSVMERPIPEMGGFSIPVTTKVGYNWGSVMLPEKFNATLTAGAVK